MDNTIGSIKKRFEQTSNFNETFGLLYTIGKLRSVTEEDIRKHCKDLALQLQVGDENDLCLSDLFDELLICRNIVDESATPIEVLCKLKKFSGAFPNLSIALRIMMTIPITSADAERRFSKLKIIKNYLRSSMSHERLNVLILLILSCYLSDRKRRIRKY